MRAYAYLLVAAVLVGGGGFAGYKVRDSSCLSALVEDQNAALELARKQSEIAKRRWIEEGRREAMAGQRSEEARRAGVEHALSEPSCVLSDESRRLFSDAIDAANATD